MTDRRGRHVVIEHHADAPAVVPTGLAQRDGWGIDRVSITFRVRDLLELDRFDRVTRSSDGSWSAQTKVGPDGPGQVFVSVQTVVGAPWCKAEVNPSRFVDPDGCGLLPPRQLHDALEVMWAAARQVAAPYPGQTVDDCNVTRLDIARDFRGVMSPALYVQGLGSLRRPYAKRGGLYSDPQCGDAQTAHVGNKGGGMVRLYDQHAAYAEKGAPVGSLRWEVEARRGWLKAFDVQHVRDLDMVAVERLAVDRWGWSRMGETVSGPVRAVDVLSSRVRSGELKLATAQRLLGMLIWEAELGSTASSGRSERRHREVLRDVGVTSQQLWGDALARQAAGRLDFETGTELLELTA